MLPNDAMGVRAAAAFVALLCAAAALESYSVARQVAATSPDTYGIQPAITRFAALQDKLPRDQQIGYLTDLEDATQKATVLLSAQYALAPRLLIPAAENQPREWAVGNFHKPQDFAAAGARYGYDLVEHAGNGVVLYRKRSAK
jgi:hypothetical protein